MDADDPLWTELQGRYRPERPLGAGGMAEVWLVHDERHGRLVALKLLGEHLASAMGQDRFKREIALLARLQHPNVLPLIDSGENAGRMWYVTPFIEGESLRDRLDREGKLDVTEALRLGGELLDALGYAHRSGVVHRDIKPENVLLSQGHALLADFGIAREEGKDRLTATGLSVGTPSYMSPEQVAGEQADASSDLYSMGCVLFECLAGQPPFVGPDARAVMAQHVMDPAPSLRARRPNVPEGVERIVLRALEKDPKDRWPDAAAFARALNEPAAAKADLVGSGMRTARPRARRRLLAAAGVVVAIAAVAGGVTLWRSRGKVAVGPKVTLRQVTFRGDVCRSEISPDGRYVAYYAGKQVWLTDIERDRTWAVGDYVETGRCNWLGWTADGSGIAWELHDSTYLAGTNGEKARAVGVRNLLMDSLWSRGGWAIRNFDTGPGDRINRVSLRQLGHSASRMISSAFFEYGNPLSPDGSRAIMNVQGRWALVDVASGRVAPLDSGATIRFPVAWSADSRAVYVYSDSVSGLLRLELDRDRLRLTGRRTRLLPGLDSRSWARSAAVWRNRVVIDRTRESRSLLVGRLSTVGGRPRFSVEELAAGSLIPKSAAFAPRHDRLFFIAEADGADGLFEMALPGGAPHRVALLPNGGFDLRLSPDGSTAVVGSRDGQRLKATLVDLRTASTRDLPGWSPSNKSYCQAFDWDPTGRSVLAADYARAGTRASIIRLNAVTGVADTLRADSSAAFLGCPAASPDGRWVAVHYEGEDTTGGYLSGIYLLPLSGDPGRLLSNAHEYPLGWLNPHEVLVAQTSSPDSTGIWLYDLAGKRSRLGTFKAGCTHAPLSPGRSEIVCDARRWATDVWIADDFDPYFRPPVAAKRP